MMISSPPGQEPITHVALSSLERSALQIASFDPAAVASILAGARINLIDADDSGTLKHAVALADLPERLWRAVAPSFLGKDLPPVEPVSVAELYASRAVPDPCRVARFIALAPAELEAALEADHPHALAAGNATGARVHCMNRIRWSGAHIAFPEPDDFSENAWWAAAKVMPQPKGPRWAPHLLARRRAIFHEARTERATGLLAELHSALWIVCESPFACGQDFGAYHATLMQQVMTDSRALELLRADRDGQFAVITEALGEAGHDWRTAYPLPTDITATA